MNICTSTYIHTPPFLHISSFAPPELQFPPVTVSQGPLVVQLTTHDPMNKQTKNKQQYSVYIV